jgi:Haem-binding domain
MSIKRKALIGLVIILIGIQFIRPARNVGEAEGPNEISKKYQVVAEIHAVLKQSCYDCHSNNTRYPWYINIQPVGWWMQSHVNEGRHHLNFSEFGKYPEKKAKHKFEEIEDAASNGWMPLDSYLWIHHDAKLTPDQSKAIAMWAGGLK